MKAHLAGKIWNMDRYKYEKARKRVDEKKSFYQNLGAYLMVIPFLFLLNIFTGTGHFWFIYPALGWGMGLLGHYFKAFGYPGMKGEEPEWEQREMDKELRRLNAGRPEEEEDYLELRDYERQPQKGRKWRDDDLV